MAVTAPTLQTRMATVATVSIPRKIPLWVIEKTLSQHVTVALNGSGGDELFAGYGRYFQMPVEQRYLGLPGWLRNGVIEPLGKLVNPMNAWRLSRAELFEKDPGAYHIRDNESCSGHYSQERCWLLALQGSSFGG